MKSTDYKDGEGGGGGTITPSPDEPDNIYSANFTSGKGGCTERLLRMKAVTPPSGNKTVNLVGKELLTQEERTMSQMLIFAYRKSI